MLLLMAGDVERNPGPVICAACQGLVRKNQPPARCSGCGEERHLKCLGVSWSATKNIKKDTYTVQGCVQWYNWMCPACSGQARVEATVGEVRSGEAGAGSGQAQVEASAGETRSGEAGAGSGLARVEATAGEASSGEAGRVGEGGETSDAGVGESNSVGVGESAGASQGDEWMVQFEWVSGRIKCSGCPGHLFKAKKQRPVVCRTCDDKFHQSCTKLTRDALKVVKRNEYTWICSFCRSKPSASAPCPDIEDEVNDVATGMKTEDREYLTVLQWNADGINTKSDELQTQLKALNIDVCLIQESKLTQGSIAPHFSGYKSIRSDRKVTKKGGGLLSLIKETLVVEKVHEGWKGGTEAHTFRVRMARNKWLTITNVYCPPVNSKGQTINTEVAGEMIPTAASSLIAGDFNAHSILWDEFQPPDERGDKLIDWMVHNDLTLLNSGEPTRTNIGTANVSVPDVTFCGTLWKGKTNWHVSEAIGSSDHLPIVITINSKVQHQPVLGAKAKWKRNGVEWKDFTEAVEQAISGMETTGNINKRVEQFAKILHDAATTHVGRVKPRKKKRNLWMTPTVRGMIRQRNHLRRDLKNRKKEWLQACKETNDAIKEAKTECWREVVEEALMSEDEGKTWNFIKTLNGTPDSNSPNEVLVVNGRKITSNKKKADAFIEQYADVSKLSFDKEERLTNRRAKNLLRKSQHVGDESTRPFVMEELEKAIQKMRSKGAAGEDEIPPSFLKALGPLAKEALLDIFNQSFDDASVPQMWRRAIIIPLLKAGKAAGELASFRPVSLTSCVVKTMERMVGDRLYYIAETRGMFSDLQAGFRRGRSCEDQILKMVQAIEDGFQKKKMERSVLVMLDYSKAYDKVWQQRLLLAMEEKGVPMKFLKWIDAFLGNRLARVRFQDATSKVRVMRQGLPQGAVLSPLLFLFFIDNLAKELPSETLNALFADDVTALATARTKEEAVHMAQKTVDIVAEWSRQWKLDLNATKSEVAFFSTYTKESTFVPSIKLRHNEFHLLFDEGDEFTFRATPRLLGVILDRQLCFGPQVANVVSEATKKSKMLYALAGSDWGAGKKYLRMIYLAFCRSKMMYSAPAWQSWLSETQIDHLEVAQNKACRTIAGQYSGSPVESSRMEAGLSSMRTVMKREIVRAGEKAKRMPVGHPRRTAWEASDDRRNRKSWRSECKDASSSLPDAMNACMPLDLFSAPPWLKSNFEVYPKVPGLQSRHEEESRRRGLAMERIDSLNGDWVLYTDGSADAGISMGGSAVVVTRGSADEPVETDFIMEKGAALTCSCEEEEQALLNAAKWIQQNGDPDQTVVIATDSQSLCSALQSRSANVGGLISEFAKCPGKVVIQWVPGHSEIPGNEMADARAKEATSQPGEGRAISYKSACATINRHIKDPPQSEWNHARSAAVYSAFSESKEKAVTIRNDQVLLARVRAGKHLGFAEFRARIKKETDSSCARCGAAVEDLEHWLECPGTMEIRFRLFGKTNVGLDILTANPTGAVKLARSTLRTSRLGPQ